MTMSDEARPIIGIGEILWDLLPDGKKLGGTVANVAHHVHQLGEWAEIVSCVGDDTLGVEVRETLRGLGISDRYIATDPQYPTGTVEVRMGVGGQPLYSIRERVAWDGVPLTEDLLDLAARCRAICFGTLAQRSERSRATVRALVNAAPLDALRVFDMNLRHNYYDRDVIEYSLNAATVLKLNHEELIVVRRLLDLPPGDDAALSQLQWLHNIKLIALTRGGDGSKLYADNFRDEHPGNAGDAVTVMDTIGAGDAFTAALVVGLLRGLPLSKVHSAAAKVAGYVCTQTGGTPRLPDTLKQSLR